MCDQQRKQVLYNHGPYVMLKTLEDAECLNLGFLCWIWQIVAACKYDDCLFLNQGKSYAKEQSC
jgi:hypothetical protein